MLLGTPLKDVFTLVCFGPKSAREVPLVGRYQLLEDTGLFGHEFLPPGRGASLRLALRQGLAAGGVFVLTHRT